MKKENKKENKNKLFQVIAGLGAVALMSGAVIAVDAAGNNSLFQGDTQGQALRQHQGLNLSDEERQEFFDEREENREEMRQDMESRHEAVVEAVNAGSYTQWLEAVGEDSPISEKINADNFSTYTEAFKLMEEAREKFSELGLDRGVGFGHGQGGMMRGAGGHMLGQNIGNR